MPIIRVPEKGCVWKCVPGPPPYDTKVCKKVCPTIVANPFPQNQPPLTANPFGPLVEVGLALAQLAGLVR